MSRRRKLVTRLAPLLAALAYAGVRARRFLHRGESND